MNPLYNAGISLYCLGARVASLRSSKVAGMLAGQRDTLCRLAGIRKNVAPDGFDVWIHAASLGEFEQARPLIERLKRENGDVTVLLTFFSPSGYVVRHDYENADAVVYLPFDTPSSVSDFLDASRPKMAIFVKYEFWGNYLEQLHARGIPVYIISAIFRAGQIFFRPWGGMFRRMLGCFEHIYVQDENSRSLLASIGIGNVTVAGDTRFDRVTDVMRSANDMPMIGDWAAGSFTLVAGSSWPADEDRYIPWLDSHGQVKAIIAPHEMEGDRLMRLRRLPQGKVMLLSEAERAGVLPDDVKVLIVDCFGKLSSLYRYGDVALIGGGFGSGIHNINEAAVYGIPVLFGPNHYKFKEASDLIACGGGYEYRDQNGLSAILDRFLDDVHAVEAAGNAAEDYIKSHLGATDTIYDDLFV